MDNLDQLSDAALSETFAVEVAGYTKQWADFTGPTLTFATSADAVLPWVEQHAEHINTHRCSSHWTVAICIPNEKRRNFVASASNFPRAACIALIRAKRAEKTP